MKKTTKAVLLSAFVFPGAGHIYLKKYLHGVVLIGVSLAAIYYIISKTIESALQVAEKVQNGSVPIDAEVISELVSNQSSVTDVQIANIITAVLIVCWIVSIVDSYRVAQKQRKT